MPEPAVASEPVVVGVDVGGTKVLAAVVDDQGRVVRRLRVDTPPRSAPPIATEDVVVAAVEQLVEGDRLAAVGLAAAGFVDAAGERVRFAPHVGWRDEPVRSRLAQRLGVPVHLDNDATCALWGEHRFGSARDAADVLLVAVGTGIGGALMVAGRLWRGHGGMAGEFGHVQVRPDGRPCECGLTGCWEQYVSGRALARRSRPPGGRGSTDGPEVSAAAQRGEAWALAAFAEVGHDLGVGLAGLVASFDPALVVVGGGLAAADDLLLEPAREALRSRLPGAVHREVPPVVAARLGVAAGVVGVADLARRLVAP